MVMHLVRNALAELAREIASRGARSDVGQSCQEKNAMSNFTCCLWWLVAGLVLGWLLSWLFDKLFRRDGEAAGVRLRSEIDGLNRRIAELTTLASDAESREQKALAAAEDLTRRNAELTARRIEAKAPAKRAGIAVGGLAEAGVFGFAPQKSGVDDLVIIEGIGPNISELLHRAGITTFRELAAAPLARLQEILRQAGPNFRLADPESWPPQAALCVKGDWAALRKLQDELIAEVEPSKKKEE
jgi:predicted flap endonuclease-1-like 5' DNA nuclease